MKLHELEFRQALSTERGSGLENAKVDAKLASYGFQKIGTNSSYGRVYSHPKFDYVVKIYNNDPCYTKFVALAMSMPNPHFPKFRGKLTKIINNVYAIRMERLTSSRISSDLLAYIMSELYIEQSIRSFYQNKVRADIRTQIEQQYPELEKACKAILDNIIQKYPPRCVVDILGDNIMLRGNVPVIVDPIA